MKTSRIGLILLLLAFLAASVALIGCPPQGGDAGVDDGMVPPPPDEPPGPEATGETTTIDQIGSTTVLPIAEKWAVAFAEKHEGVEINVSGGGSGTGISSLINGTADIANASRQIKDEEIEQARENGVNPVEHVVAYDGIAAIVHPSNPIESLTIEQLSDIYAGEITNWSEVGGEDGEIIVVSRDSASGTYESWKEMVIQMGGEAEDRDYTPAALKQGSNEAVRSTVAETEGTIGYIGLGYLDDNVKALAVAPEAGAEAVMPTPENVQNGSYPISRELYMYTDGEPTGVLAEYFDWGMGEEGQALVEEAGFVPVQ